jgi:hypothetical protein
MYKAALLNWDLELASKLTVPGNTSNLEMYKQLGKARTVEIISNMGPIEEVMSHPDYAKYRIKRKENGKDITYYIYFRLIQGKWLVYEY